MKPAFALHGLDDDRGDAAPASTCVVNARSSALSASSVEGPRYSCANGTR